LAASGPAEAVDLLQAAAVDSNVEVSTAALSGLAAIKSSDAIAALLTISVDPKRRDACIHVLQGAGDVAVPYLAQGLHNSDADVRRTIVEVLCRVHTSRAIEALRTAVDDPHPSVRFAVSYALARFCPPSSTDPVMGSRPQP
jgi:HEAT repeat protein